MMSRLSPVGLALLGAFVLALGSSCGVVEIHPRNEQPPSGQTGSGGSPFSGGTGGIPGLSGSGGSTGTPDGGSGTGGRLGDGGTATGSGGTGVNGPGAGGASGIMVNLGGTIVPKEKVIAFIHFGHSNMAGRGQTPQSLHPYFFTTTTSDVDKRSWMYHTSGPYSGFQPVLDPFAAGDDMSKNPSKGGPGLPLVKEAAKAWPGYYFVSLGYGQNSQKCLNFLPGTTNYTAATAAAKALVGKVTFGAIVVMLGITERHTTNTADYAKYPSCINTVVTQIRKDIGEPNLPLLLTDYEQWANNSLGDDLRPTGPFGSAIIPYIKMVPTTVTNSALVRTDNCMNLVDDHHFQLDSQQNWALNALDILKSKPEWTPWLK